MYIKIEIFALIKKIKKYNKNENLDYIFSLYDIKKDQI